MPDTAPVAPYEIYAIKYGDRMGERGTMFVHGDPHDAPIAMDYFIWVIRNDRRTIVIDVGYDRAEGEGRGRSFLRSPVEGLALLDIDAAGIEDVIITHMHYDHAGNLDLFPKARFHIQDEEMSFVTGRAMTHPAMRHSFKLDDVLEMVRLTYGDRVVFHAGDEQIAPGVTVHHLPGHTRGLQAVRVESQRGPVVLASDVAHYYECFELGTPFLTHENLFEMLESNQKLRTLAPDDDHIVPGHDPAVLQRYPAPSPDLAGIVARLDVPPNS
ncbi:MAG: N-acyl homoserine lactonase family protein [Proteobacteria bacterium]|nr:N-acyl homoserine lactonase family protein [Pseudomonadota bacterium]